MCSAFAENIMRRFLTKKQARDITTLSFAEMARREAKGTFPERQRLSADPRGRVAYHEEDIQKWCENPTSYRVESHTDRKAP